MSYDVIWYHACHFGGAGQCRMMSTWCHVDIIYDICWDLPISYDMLFVAPPMRASIGHANWVPLLFYQFSIGLLSYGDLGRFHRHIWCHMTSTRLKLESGLKSRPSPPQNLTVRAPLGGTICLTASPQSINFWLAHPILVSLSHVIEWTNHISGTNN